MVIISLHYLINNLITTIMLFNMVLALMLSVAIIGHFVADFIFQSDETAKGKSGSLLLLSKHCLWYTIVMTLFTIFIFQRYDLVLIGTSILVYFTSHFIIDAITSRVAKYFFLKEARHNFFLTIGIDQALHTIVILWFIIWNL